MTVVPRETLPFTSKELRAWSVVLSDDNSQPRDPTGLTVTVAFPTAGNDPATWTAATWNTDMSTDPDTYWAELLVSGTGGGGTVELAKGVYDVWIRVADGTQSPTRLVSRMAVR